MGKTNRLFLCASALFASVAVARPEHRDPANDIIRTLALRGDQAAQVSEIFKAARIEREADADQADLDHCAHRAAVHAELETVLSAEQLDELRSAHEARRAERYGVRGEERPPRGRCDA